MKNNIKLNTPVIESKLIKSELRYRRLFEAAQDGILILDAVTGMIEDVNPYLINMLGYTREEFIKKKLWEVGAFRDIEASQEAFEALQKNEYIRYDDLPLKTKNGKLIQVEFVSNLYLVGDENVIQCNIRDITERKRLAKELAENEKKYTNLVDQSPDGIFIIDLDGKFLSVNNAICNGLGFSQEELLALSIQDIVTYGSMDKFKKGLEQIIQGKVLDKSTEYALQGKDGKTHYIEVISAPYYVDGKVSGLQGIARDVTTRKQTEAALQSSNQVIDGIFNTIPVRVFWKDLNLVYLGCNEAFAHDAGFNSPNEIIGKDDLQLGWKDRAELYRKDDREVIEKGTPKLQIEEPLTKPDGTTIDLLTSKVPLRNAAGEIIGLIGTYTDITVRKMADEALRKSHEMIVKLTAMVPGVVYQFRSWPDGRSAFPFSSLGMNIIYEVTPEEVREDATPVYSRIHPEDYDNVVELINESARTLLPFHCEYRVILPRQGLRWRLSDALPERMEDGSTLWYGIISDVSERKLAEQVLEQERRDYQAIIDTAPVMVAYKSKDDHFVKVNAAYADFVELTPEQIIGKTTFELIKQPEVAQLGRDSDLEVMRTGKPILNQLIQWSGFSSPKKSWVTFSKLPFKDADGNIIGTVSFITDVDDRVKAENAVRESEERYRQTLESMMEGCQIIGFDWRYLFVNDAAASQGKLPKEGMLDHTMMECYPGIEKTAMFIELQHCMNQRISHQMENEFSYPDGTKGWFELSIQPSPNGIFILSTEITSRKLAEVALSKQNEALMKLNQYSIELSMSPMKEDIEKLIARQIKEICGAELSVFSEYNSANQTTTTTQIEMNPGLIDKVVHLLGKQVTDVHTIVSDEMYREMTNQSYGVRKTLSEISFGAISPQVGRAIQALLKVDRFIGIAYLAEGKLYGISALGMKKDQPDPAEIIIENYISLAASTLRRKLAEGALIQANQRLSLAQHSSRAGMWDWDIITGKLEWSPELFELFGLDAATVPTFDVWQSVIYPDDVKLAGDRIEQAIQEHKPLFNEYRIVLPTGAVLWINALGDTIYNEQGEPQCMSGICIDITERKRVEQKIQRQFEHLNSLSAIDRVITTNFDLKLSLEEILTHVIKELVVDAADILLLDPVSGILEFSAKRGFISKAVKKTQLRLGESFAGRVALERKLVHIPDLRTETDTELLATITADDHFVTYFGVPLINKGKVSGVLEVFHRKPLQPDEEWVDFLKSLAGQAAIAIENVSLFDSQQRSNQELTLAYDATIEGWSHAMDLRDKDTEGHTLRVTEVTLKLARVFGLNDEELLQVRWGTLLHDIGKIGVPDGILLKPGPLTEEEWVMMRKHPTFAYEMLSPINYLRRALDIPHSHHEKWDGSGYPQGLKGKQIPLAARIFAVVDVWDALRSDRPYRLAWPDEKVYEHIRSLSGTHFDPQVVEVFLKQPR